MQRNETAIINELYSRYQANGFISEEEALDLMATNNVSLQDTERLTGILLGLGIIFVDEVISDDDDYIDKSRTDYEIIFNEVLRIAPGQAVLIDYIRNIRPPQWREWRVLMPQAKAGNQYAFNRLFEMYLRVVVKLSLNLHKRYGYELDDLLQEGALGLMKAIRSYDSTMHGSFVSYFPFWVKQRINRAIADSSRTIRIPVHLHEIMEKYQATIIKLEISFGRIPSIAEVSDEMEMSVEEVEQVQGYCYKIESIEEYLTMHSEDDFSEKNLIDTTPFDDVYKRMLRDVIISVLNSLTNREASVMRLRFGIDDQRERTLEEVGTVFNLTRERIRQIEAKALRRLRNPSRIKKLKGYLD
jgi:RNA polymerase primary sigma factor